MILNYHQESDSPRIAVIGLHGWTGTEHSMVPVARSMRIQSAKWYIPRAPYKASMGQGHTWFSGSPDKGWNCLLYTSPSPRDGLLSRMPSSA